MRVEFRPTAIGDVMALLGQLPAERMIGLSAYAGDELVGIGGLLIKDNGEVWASMRVTEAARRYPRAIHRGGKALMELARSKGFRCVYASAEDSRAGADRWLEGLGFRRDRGGVFVWRCDR